MATEALQPSNGKLTIDLRQGDCLEVMKGIPDGSVDMVLCDLPYGVTACKWDKIIPVDQIFQQYVRICKRGGVIALFGSEPFSSILRTAKMDWFKYDWIWNKKKGGNIFLAKYQPMKIHEIISVFTSGGNVYNPQKVPRDKIKRSKNYGTGQAFGGDKTPENKIYEYDSKNPVSILEYSNAVQKGKVHPTQKPVALLEYLIKTYTNEGETVLDNCMGSGSTGVACVNTKRNFIGIELDPGYYEIAKKRIEEAERQ